MKPAGPLFALPGFRRLFASQASSRLGDGMVGVALAFAVLHVSRSPSALGLVLAARSLPLVGLLLVGGVVGDRFPRRTVMASADAVRVVTQGALAWLLLAGNAQIWELAVLSGIGGAASAFYTPAASGLTPSVVPPEHLQRANSVRSISSGVGATVGPVVAGLLVAGPGAGWAFAADAATFGVSAICLIGLPRGDGYTAPGSMLRGLAAGWQDFVSRTWLWTTITVEAIANLMFASFNVLGPIVALRALGGARDWAVMVAALGVGSVLGGFGGFAQRPRRPVLAAVLGLACLPLPLAALALPTPTALAAAAAGIAGLGVVYGSTLWVTTFQRHVPGEMLARVSSYDSLGSLVTQPIGLAIWGPIAGLIGVSPALWVAFGVQLVCTLGLTGVKEVRQMPPAPPASAVT